MVESGPKLRLVGAAGDAPPTQRQPAEAADRELDWSILMARAQQGNAEAYRRLLEEITPFLRILCARRHHNPSDVEEGVQEILITLHRVRITYDPARPFGPWLVAIANRRLIDQVRVKARRRGREQPLEAGHHDIADPAPSAEETAERRRLEAAIAQLPPGQQQAIRLLKLDELTLREASAASGLSIAALKVATHRALQSLRQKLRGNDS